MTRPAGRLAASAYVLGALILLSGATGLSYEVLWARALSLQFGASIFGAGATVSAFMLGLGAGALLAARWLARATARQSVLVFALLELAVAAYALALPAIEGACAPLVEALAAHLQRGPWLALQAAGAVILLALPAAAMGASFPAALRALPDSPGLVGRVYAINCLGAAAGALLSAGLLADVGWADALHAIAALGGGVSAVACVMYAVHAGPTPGAGDGHMAPPDGGAARTTVEMARLFAYAGVGALALLLELAWTRLYGIVMLRTEYVLAMILAVYLLGTALGSALTARLRTPRSVELACRAVPLLACTAILVGLWTLPWFSRWSQQVQYGSLAAALGGQALALGGCMLPTTAALGAWLPLLARRGGGAEPAGLGGAMLYGANCLGAALGAALAVALAIPALGSAASVALCAVGLLALGPTLGPWRIQVAALPFALAAAWGLRHFPPPERMLPPGALAGAELYRYEDALSLNHVTATPDGQRILMTDLRHLDASSEPSAVRIQANQGRLPLLLHAAPHSVLFLGLGTGISASASRVYAGLASTAVEISPGAIEAARRWFEPVNGGITRTLRIAVDDARHFLMSTGARYDVIVGDLFHPDLAGMGGLLSVEQFGRARARLADDGVFVQWVALNQFDAATLEAVLRAFDKAFPGAQLFVDGLHLAMVGSPAPLRDAQAMTRNLGALPAPLRAEATGGEGAATWLGRYWGPIGAGVGPVQSELRPVIEYRLPGLRYGDRDTLGEVLRMLLRRRPDARAAAVQLGVGAEQWDSFESAYTASALAAESWLAGIENDTPRSIAFIRLAYEANPSDHWAASALADDMYAAAQQQGITDAPGTLERILHVDPENVGALRALWHRERDSGRADAGRMLARLRALAPLDAEAAADVMRASRN